MTRQQIIDILEAYKPSGNIYNGYNSIEEKIDERICYLIDEIVESVKREPDDDSKWIKCSDRMPEEYKKVLLYHGGYILIGYYMSVLEMWSFEGNSMPQNKWSVTHWMPLPEMPKEGLKC